MMKLVIADEEGKTTAVVPLVRDEITIGRKEGNTIRLTERNVSRSHAKIERRKTAEESEGFYVVDLGSYNGVKINGDKIKGEHQLSANDVVTVGDYQLVVEDESKTGSTQPERHNPISEEAKQKFDKSLQPTVPPVGPLGGMASGRTSDETVGFAADMRDLISGKGIQQFDPVKVDSAKVGSARASVNDAAMTIPERPSPRFVTMAALPARLVMLSEPSKGAEFSFGKDVMRIGRDEALDIWLNHRSVSRQHAELLVREGSVLVRDLDSANGLRVNGKAVKESQLRSGDILEVGQVLLRFVPAGEAFEISPSSRSQNKGGVPKWTWLAAGGLVVVALISAFFIVNGGRNHRENVSSVHASTQNPVLALPTKRNVDTHDVRSSIAACQAALAAGEFGAARHYGQRAQELGNGDAEAGQCLARVEQEEADSAIFSRGLVAHRGGRFEEAHRAFSELSPSSTYRQRSEVMEARNAYGAALLERAERTAETDAAEALRLANGVARMVDEAEVKRRAEALARRLRRTVPEEEVPSETPQPQTGENSVVVQEVQACLARDDQRCVINVLRGRANNERDLGLLIETHLAVGEPDRAVTLMRTYVRRFPRGRNADTYRHTLELSKNSNSR